MAVLAGAAVVAAMLDQPPPVSGMARASDGDSFRLGDDRVRLLGLDAPELAQDCTRSDGSSWSCGRTARDRLAALLASGKADCRPQDTDQYGRLLAICIVSGLDVGATMVSEGLAVSSGRYSSQEASARAGRRGIWAGDFEAPRSWRDDHPRPQGVSGWLSAVGSLTHVATNQARLPDVPPGRAWKARERLSRVWLRKSCQTPHRLLCARLLPIDRGRGR